MTLKLNEILPAIRANDPQIDQLMTKAADEQQIVQFSGNTVLLLAKILTEEAYALGFMHGGDAALAKVRAVLQIED